MRIVLVAIVIIVAGNWSECAAQDHHLWEELLQSHVDREGWVDYVGFVRDESKLQEYLDWLSANPPEELDDHALAYWINAYNAFTVKLILEYYPVESIRDIGSKPMIPKINSPWDIRFITIGDQKYDLNNIEHSILRKKFDDPRIHFSIVCASRSCPRLRNEAYTGANVQALLDEDARVFINDSSRNEISQSGLRLSKIFDWYKGDFTTQGSLVDFLNQYSDKKIDSDGGVFFLKYDWTLNRQ